jgi:hypothetical protein
MDIQETERFTLDWNFLTENRDGAPVLVNGKIM